MNPIYPADVPLRIAFVGWGAIARRVAGLLAERNAGAIEIVAICARSAAAPPDLPDGVAVVSDPDELAQVKPHLVIEAAGRAAVSQWAEAALRHAPALAVVSTSALCDADLLDRLLAVAERHGSRLLITPGALAGIDALAAACTLGLDEVVHKIVKPPVAWMGTGAEARVPLAALTGAVTFFEGSAREAAEAYPENANVAVITALAGIGLDRTRVHLVADPAAEGNRHELHAVGAFGRLDVRIENRPLRENPKSSEMAALGLVRLVENLKNHLVI